LLTAILTATALSPRAFAAKKQRNLEDYKAIYEKSSGTLDDACVAEKKKALKQYETGLTKLVTSARKAGDLDGLVAGTAEQERFDTTSTVPDSPPEQSSPAIESLRERYHSAVANSESEKAEKNIDLLRKYVKGLKSLQKSHVKSNEIEKAMAVKEEVQRAEFILADLASRMPQPVVKEESARPRKKPREKAKEKPKDVEPSTMPPVPDGLQLHYSFDGMNESLRQGGQLRPINAMPRHVSQMLVKDETAGKRHGTPRSTRWVENGRFGGACQFDGTRSFIEMQRPFVMGDSPLSFAAWIKTGVATQQTIHEYGGRLTGYVLFLREGRLAFAYRWGQRNRRKEIVATRTRLADDRWHFVGFTIDDRGMTRLYLDGVAVSKRSVKLMSSQPNESAQLGCSKGSNVINGRWNPSHFAGTMDEVMVWNRALSEIEMKQFYKAMPAE